MSKQKQLRYFAIEKGDEKHLIRYYDDDIADVARQLQFIANSDQYQFDKFDLIQSILRLCNELAERQMNEDSTENTTFFNGGI